MKWVLFLSIFSLLSCGIKKDYSSIPTYTHNKLNAVVEIPNGTNLKIEYDHKKNTFLPDQREGKDRYIEFLGYPGNYGFIPSTYSDPARGGDGDALDVIILGSSLPTGTVQQIIPIGLLKLVDAEELDYKIIALPDNLKKRNIQAEKWQNLAENYPGVIEILATWFQEYDKGDSLKIEGWGDEQEALKEIEKWSIKAAPSTK